MKRILTPADRLLSHPAQLQTIRTLSRGEEGKFFTDKMKELAQTLATMPKPYKTDGQDRRAESGQRLS